MSFHNCTLMLKKAWSKCVLVLAGIELIFLTVAPMVLCFGFAMKTVLITQGCFSYR